MTRNLQKYVTLLTQQNTSYGDGILLQFQVWINSESNGKILFNMREKFSVV
jgi:hypothetical protein